MRPPEATYGAPYKRSASNPAEDTGNSISESDKKIVKLDIEAENSFKITENCISNVFCS